MRSREKIVESILENKELFKTGLCHWLKELLFKDVISPLEYLEIKEYLDKYSWDNNEFGTYFWDVQHIEPRIKWLQEYYLGKYNVKPTLWSKLKRYFK